MLVQETMGCGLAVGLGEPPTLADAQLLAIANEVTTSGGYLQSKIENSMATMSETDAQRFAQVLLSIGADPTSVRYALDERMWRSGSKFKINKTYAIVWGALGTASMAASAYHGWKRTGSWGWTLGWAFMGGLFPVFTPAVALAQGFGKPKR